VAQVIHERVCVEVDGEIVLFLIGMRINRLRRRRPQHKEKPN